MKKFFCLLILFTTLAVADCAPGWIPVPDGNFGCTVDASGAAVCGPTYVCVPISIILSLWP